jgi:hypothetical protein
MKYTAIGADFHQKVPFFVGRKAKLSRDLSPQSKDRWRLIPRLARKATIAPNAENFYMEKGRLIETATLGKDHDVTAKVGVGREVYRAVAPMDVRPPITNKPAKSSETGLFDSIRGSSFKLPTWSAGAVIQRLGQPAMATGTADRIPSGFFRPQSPKMMTESVKLSYPQLAIASRLKHDERRDLRDKNPNASPRASTPSATAPMSVSRGHDPVRTSKPEVLHAQYLPRTAKHFHTSTRSQVWQQNSEVLRNGKIRRDGTRAPALRKSQESAWLHVTTPSGMGSNKPSDRFVHMSRPDLARKVENTSPIRADEITSDTERFEDDGSSEVTQSGVGGALWLDTGSLADWLRIHLMTELGRSARGADRHDFAIADL